MINDEKLMQQALDALEWAERRYSFADLELFNKPIEALRARLAQPEPEPVAWMKECADFWEHYSYINESAQEKYESDAKMWIEKLRTAPPQREWQSLTDEEAKKEFEKHNCTISADLAGILARAIEAKLKEKNI